MEDAMRLAVEFVEVQINKLNGRSSNETQITSNFGGGFDRFNELSSNILDLAFWLILDHLSGAGQAFARTSHTVGCII